MNILNVNNIREHFKKMYEEWNYTIIEKKIKWETVEEKVIEILWASFIADEEAIFWEVNWDYVNKELDWYKSQSLNVYDMSNPPKIWRDVSDKDWYINSNYWYLIYSKENFEQYKHVLRTLRKNPYSRQAVMIYTRPTIHEEYNKNWMYDFICTNSVAYYIRKENWKYKLHCVIQMRSNDAVFWYKNDRAWQKHVLNQLVNDLKQDYEWIEPWNIYWQVQNLHIYERHFKLIK